MAQKILSTAQTNEYRLPESIRQEILSQSHSAQLRQQIERERVAFVQRHGSEFGVEPESNK